MIKKKQHDRLEKQRKMLKEHQKNNQRSEKQGSFLKGSKIDKILKVKYVNEGFNQTLKCKVDWCSETKEITNPDNGFKPENKTTYLEPSLESIAAVKDKDPVKLLDFFE